MALTFLTLLRVFLGFYIHSTYRLEKAKYFIKMFFLEQKHHTTILSGEIGYT